MPADRSGVFGPMSRQAAERSSTQIPARGARYDRLCQTDSRALYLAITGLVAETVAGPHTFATPVADGMSRSSSIKRVVTQEISRKHPIHAPVVGFTARPALSSTVRASRLRVAPSSG